MTNSAKVRGRHTPAFRLDDRVRANDEAPADCRGRVGTVNETGPGKTEFGVTFDDGQQPLHGYLMSWWLDKVPK